MKWAYAFLVILASLLFVSFTITRFKSAVQPVTPEPAVTLIPTQVILNQKIERTYLFIPYWSIDKNISATSHDSLIYFGIGVNGKGIDASESGYIKTKQFVSLAPKGPEKILAVRMINSSVNSDVLKSSEIQANIISDTISFAHKNNFDGILLDFETSALGFESTINRISSFYQEFSQKVHDSNLKFYVTLFGDTYFRARAYDVKAIGKVSDKVIVMAYDFSKSKGDPGPNFPLAGASKYGYDLGKMVDDFQKDVSNEKLVITLGYFGYDWRVDKNNFALASGVPLSTIEIKQKFITKCLETNCQLQRIADTKEPYIIYTDKNNASHIVWFEDEQSVNVKKEFLKKKGILEIGIWAYSYY